jgi:hypothetical protein
MTMLPISGRSDLPKHELNQRVIRESLQCLPDEDVYPETTSNMTLVSSTRINETLFLKRSGWIDEDYSLSAQHHDEIALDKIQDWMERLTRAEQDPEDE